MAEYKIKDAKNADLDEIYFDKNVGKMCYKNALGIITTLETSNVGNVVQSVVAGTNVTVDNTDPTNPIVNATSGGGGGIHALNPLSGFAVHAQVTNGGFLNVTLASNRLYSYPFIPAKNIISSSIYTQVISPGTAGSIGRFLIYSSVNNLPSTKLYESANLDLTTTGIKTAAVTFNFTAGTTYWLAFHSGPGGAQIYGISGTDMIPLRTNGISNTNFAFSNIDIASSPTTFSATPSFSNAETPLIAIIVT